ncbi:MAG: methionyl-tRNA formyltransferase [Hyphomicrobiales bacterium]
MKLIYMSSSDFGEPALKSLISSHHEIAGVYTQPPKRSGRGMKFTKSPIYKIAEEHNLLIKTPHNLTDEDEIKSLKQLSPDIGVVVSYGLIIPKKFLSIPRYGFLNIHPSLLPRWRGAAPIQRALIEGDKVTGVNIIRLDEGLDTGDICKYHEIPINMDDNYATLSDKLAEIGAKLLLDSLSEFSNGKIKFIKQKDVGITYAKKIVKEETKIDFNKPCKNVVNLIKGLSPYPGGWFTYINGENSFRARILYAIESQLSGAPGEVLDSNLTIGCADKSISPILIQKEGKKPIHIEEFLRGTKIIEGSILNQ